MASKKGSARERAQQFLANIGTAGGPVGSEGLVSFGATDLASQVQYGNVDQYAAIRGDATGRVVGSYDQPAPAMPRDLDSSYMKLNLPGSPLPRLGLLVPQFQSSAEIVQNQITTSQQYEMSAAMPQTGFLPMGLQPPANSKKGNK